MNPSIFSIDTIPKCYGDECITIGIGYTANQRTPLTEYVINYLSNNYNLEINKDIQEIATNYNDLISYLTNNTNKTQTVVLFCTGEFVLPDNPYYNGSFNCLRDTPGWNIPIYSLLINSTITPLLFFSGFNAPYPVDYASISVKIAVDNGILAFYSNLSEEESPKMSGTMQGHPIQTNRFLDGYDIVTKAGAFYFFIPPMVTFVIVLIEVVREKEYKLRHGLSMMGMNSASYCLS